MIHIYKPPAIMMMTVLPWPFARCVLTCGISLYNISCYVKHGHVTSNISMRRPRLGQVLKVTQINGWTKIQTQLSLCPWVIWIAQNLQSRWPSSLLNYVLVCRGWGGCGGGLLMKVGALLPAWRSGEWSSGHLAGWQVPMPKASCRYHPS